MRELFPRTPFGALCIFVLSAVPCLAQAGPTDSLQASFAGATWVLSTSGTSARIETPAGAILRFDLPAMAEVSSFVALDGVAGEGDGWALAGSRQDPGNPNHRRLFLMTGGATGTPRPLAEPPGQTGPERRFPVLLADGGRLAGLAWLEGDDVASFAVRAAVWTGRRFRAPAAVSRPGPGSQMGLSGAVLADGSWLLAWSAYDGEDNEIVWSRRLGNQWLPARPVSTDNAVPDITPALVATRDGALLAWSRYEEEGYRLRLARLDGNEWHGERAAGPAGSLYPSWTTTATTAGGDRPRLLYFTALPRGWVAAELDGSGRTLREAAVVAPYPERPAVLGSGENLEMRWPARRQAATAAWRVVR